MAVLDVKSGDRFHRRRVMFLEITVSMDHSLDDEPSSCRAASRCEFDITNICDNAWSGTVN
jgi:hypothetical protein